MTLTNSKKCDILKAENKTTTEYRVLKTLLSAGFCFSEVYLGRAVIIYSLADRHAGTYLLYRSSIIVCHDQGHQ